MLKAKAKIRFTVNGKDYIAHDRFDVAFRFGEGLLFSGRISGETDAYLNKRDYNVDVAFFTIDNDEAYSMVEHTLNDNARFPICAGRKIIGDALMYDFIYDRAN